MKKTIMICLAVLLLMSMAACQATPDKDIVIGKSLDDMIDKATETSESNQSASGTMLKEKLGAMDTYTKELQATNAKVMINVDAKVIIPEATAAVVQRVEKNKFTQDQVDVLIEQLVKGKIYTGDSYQLTKSEIQNQILKMQAAIAKEADAKDKNMEEAILEDLQWQLETAPETVTKTPSSGKFESIKDNSITAEEVYARAQSENDGFENIIVYNSEIESHIDYSREKNGFSSSMGGFSSKEVSERAEAAGFTPYITTEEIAQIPDVTISVEQAKEKAEALIKALGLENMICSLAEKQYGGSDEKTSDQKTYINPRKCVWKLRYMRSVNNIPITYTTKDSLQRESMQNAVSTPWPYEQMIFAVDNSGIVGFNWHSPYKITGTVTENTNLTSFDEIMSVFDSLSLAVNAWDGLVNETPDLKSVEINVDQIVFGLTRVTEQNKKDSGLLIPVWDFMGTRILIISKNGNDERFEEGPIPILTLNAIDGSVINRSLGY